MPRTGARTFPQKCDFSKRCGSLQRIIANGLVDTGRALEPDNDQMFTWWAPWRNMKERNIGWRLDYVLVSAALFARVQRCVIQREFGTSDHGPVVATLSE